MPSLVLAAGLVWQGEQLQPEGTSGVPTGARRAS